MEEAWQNWSLSQWNDALVHAAFSAAPGVPPEITRFDATPRFLAQAVGAAEDDATDVRRAFLKRFPRQAGAVRRLFDHRAQTRNWSPASAKLPFFAQLYLSLIVASADEDTFDEGNFRRRLVRLLNLTDGDYLSPDLARLWREVMRWSVSQIHSGRTVRRLVLPTDVGRETIIGYPKRLAFPSFRDETKLAAALGSNAVTADSPIDAIVSVLGSRLNQFSERFNQEYREFRRALQKDGGRAAALTPMWGAIEAVSWALEGAAGGKSGDQYLELDQSDPYAVRLYLYATKVDCPQIRSRWRYELITDTTGASVTALWPVKPASLLGALCREAEQQDGFFMAGASLAAAIKRGCVGFAEDDHGRWVSVRAAPELGQIWLLVREDLRSRIRHCLRADHALPDFWEQIPGDPVWGVAGPIDLSPERLQFLSESLPDVDLFKRRLQRPSIRMRDAIRLPDGILFLPPALPVALLDGAERITWSPLGQTNRAEHDLQAASREGEFRFPECAADELMRASSILLRGYGTDGAEIAQRCVTALDHCTTTILKTVPDPGAWRVPGDMGQMISLAEVDRQAERRMSQSAPASPASLLRPVWPVATSFAKPHQRPLSELHGAWLRAMEILASRYSRRYAVPVLELHGLVTGIWGGRSAEAWRRIDDLVENGIISRVLSRGWRTTAFVANPPRIFSCGADGRTVCRVAGLLSGLKRSEIVRVLADRGIPVLANTSPDGEVVGSLEFSVSEREDPARIAQELGLSHRGFDLQTLRTLPHWEEILAAGQTPEREFGASSHLAVWSADGQGFRATADPGVAGNRLLRWRSDRGEQYLLTWGEDRGWTTRSRDWALMARQVVADGALADIDPSGSLRMRGTELKLPPTAGKVTVAFGGGVSFVDARGARLYPEGQIGALVATLNSWVRQTGRAKLDMAVDRRFLGAAFRRGSPRRPILASLRIRKK